MPNLTDNKIILVYLEKHLQECKSFIHDFTESLSLPLKVEFEYTPEFKYNEYDNDLRTINRCYSPYAELIDTRGINNMNDQSTRLLLSDNFFSKSQLEKYEIFLHELGHFITNPELIEIRNYIAKKNPPIMSIQNASTYIQELLNKHNKSVNYLFQIPKLVQEINAELWIYNNYREYSESRLKDYCSELSKSIKKYHQCQPDKFFLFQIPELNILLLFRILVLKHTEYSFSKECSESVETLFGLLDKLAEKANCNKLKIITERENLKIALEYKKENIQDIQKLYKSIFEDFILHSVEYFPEELRNDILRFYD